jgi:hypothetical protein
MAVIKQFSIVELSIQQRNANGSPSGEKVFIISPQDAGSSTDVSPLEVPVLNQINITQDMRSPSLYGSLSIIDKSKTVESLKLSPLDMIHLVIQEKAPQGAKNPQTKSFEFSIISVSQVSEEVTAAKMGPEVIGRVINIEFASTEHYLLNYSYYDFMDQDFIGPISGKDGMIQYLSDKVFKKGATPFSTSKNPIKSDNTQNYVWLKKNYNFYPWAKPSLPPRLSSFMQMLAENAVDEKNPNAANFMFWQDLDSWNFRSIESIIKEYEFIDAAASTLNAIGSATNLGALLSVDGIQVYRNSLDTNDDRRIMSMSFTVDETPETDFMELVRSGAFGSNYLFIEPKYTSDPYARFLDTADAHEYIEIKYDYMEDYDKWKKIEKHPILSDKEYIKTWTQNRKYDQFYGYFEPNFYNRKKTVPWEYYGYSLSNRQEDVLWQTMFDITDMDGNILKKIQKEIKEPLAKKRKEYAKKMNLKEKWKVYRCSVCCAGLMDSPISGNTLSSELSSYEIVAAGSFTDVFNYDYTTINPSSNNPLVRSGLTLSYNLNESPYNLSLGEFFNLQQDPSNFTKYRFDLEIARHEKILDVLNKNIQARQERRTQYDNKINEYEVTWNNKVGLCVAQNCDDVDCTCPSPDPATVRESTARIQQDHSELIDHEESLKARGVQDIIVKLQNLKQEFLNLYGSYWSRNAFFFSKNLDFSFLKSQNNLFNVKSIKRIPIKGSKYEPFAVKKAFAGYTFASGLTQEYQYSVDKNLCSDGLTTNPYFDRKYSENRKADIWESFDNPFKNYPYSENFENDVSKGPIWYRNWLVKYKYRKKITPCITIPVQNTGCEGQCNEPACKCSCYGPVDTFCNGDDCSALGEEGVDYVRGTCEDNPQYGEGCTTTDCVLIIAGGGGGLAGCPMLTRVTASCCEDQGGQQITLDEICTNPDYAECTACQDNGDDGDGQNGGSQGIVSLTSLQGGSINSCTSSGFEDEYTDISNEMYFESFSNDKNANILNSPGSITAYVNLKLLSNCDSSNPECISIDSITAEGDEPKLMHPWGGDLISDFDYNDYKSAASLFNDNLSESIPPSLQLEGLESFVRIEFKQPIGLESLQQFPEGFVNTPGSEYFLPYIVLLTAGPFGAESARTNISVIGQDPYGFDVAVKKSKNKDDFAGMNLFDSGANESFIPLSCSSFATSSSWFRKTQNSVFYRPPGSDHDLFTPMGIQDIFSASSWERSAPVKTWWDMWFSLPPVATSLYYNRHDVSELGKVAFFKEGALIGKPQVGLLENGWPQFLLPDTENIATGVYRSDAAIFPNEVTNGDEIQGITFDSSDVPSPIEKLTDDPSNYLYRYADFPHITQIDPNKQYPVISYPVGTLIYGGAGFTSGQVWKYDSSRKTEYGLVQLSSDSMPSILALAGGLNKNIERVQKYYEWLNSKMVEWYQNTVFDNNFSGQFVVFSKDAGSGCKDYPCSNPNGFPGTNGCPQSDPLCNCPCQELRPDKITKIKDRLTGAMIPALTADFGPEPTSMELKKLKDETNECKLIEKVLGKEWLGCVWDDPESPYNCNCPCVGKYFYDYMKYNRTQSTFWSTPLKTPLFRNAQMNLLMVNEIQITVPGDLSVKTGQIILLDGSAEITDSTKKRYNGKWLVMKIDHNMNTGEHQMKLTLIRDSSSKKE